MRRKVVREKRHDNHHTTGNHVRQVHELVEVKEPGRNQQEQSARKVNLSLQAHRDDLPDTGEQEGNENTGADKNRHPAFGATAIKIKQPGHASDKSTKETIDDGVHTR